MFEAASDEFLFLAAFEKVEVLALRGPPSRRGRNAAGSIQSEIFGMSLFGRHPSGTFSAPRIWDSMDSGSSFAPVAGIHPLFGCINKYDLALSSVFRCACFSLSARSLRSRGPSSGGWIEHVFFHSFQ